MNENKIVGVERINRVIIEVRFIELLQLENIWDQIA